MSGCGQGRVLSSSGCVRLVGGWDCGDVLVRRMVTEGVGRVWLASGVRPGHAVGRRTNLGSWLTHRYNSDPPSFRMSAASYASRLRVDSLSSWANVLVYSMRSTSGPFQLVSPTKGCGVVYSWFKVGGWVFLLQHRRV